MTIAHRVPGRPGDATPRLRLVEPLPPPRPHEMRGRKALRAALLLCGVAASLVHVVANVLGAVWWDGYSSISQTVSELSALGAPSRALVLPFLVAHAVLAFAFALGVWASAGRDGALRATAGLLVGIGIVDLLAPFFPMHVRGEVATLTDTMHVALTLLASFLVLLAVGAGATTHGPRFRAYSIATLGTMLFFGAWAGLYRPDIAANQRTPWAGLTERIDVGAYLIWMAVLALLLLRADRAQALLRPAAAEVALRSGTARSRGTCRRDPAGS